MCTYRKATDMNWIMSDAHFHDSVSSFQLGCDILPNLATCKVAMYLWTLSRIAGEAMAIWN